MTEKLQAIEERYEALARQLEDPAVYGDPDFEFASSWMDVPALLAELNDL